MDQEVDISSVSRCYFVRSLCGFLQAGMIRNHWKAWLGSTSPRLLSSIYTHISWIIVIRTFLRPKGSTFIWGATRAARRADEQIRSRVQ
jgi:hypothetical protein